MKKKVTICIITFNSADFLPNLLNSIRNSAFKDFSLLFIDNNSTDETIARLKNCQIENTIIKLSRNMGHSYAANIALKECKTKYLMLLDHDTIADRNLFRNLYLEAETDQNTDFAIFAPKIIDKGRNEVYYGGQLHYLGKMCKNREEPKKLELGMVGTTSPLLDLAKIPQNIRFDNDFFIYWDDIDFFFRLRLIGKKIKFVSSAVVYHLEGTYGFSHRGGIKYSPTRAFYIIRNHRLFITKNYKFTTILIFAPCLLLYELSNIVFCLKRQIFIKGYLYSILSTVNLLSVIVKKRLAVQKKREIGEKDLVGWYKLDYNPGVVNTRIERRFKLMLDQFFKFYFSIIKNTIWV